MRDLRRHLGSIRDVADLVEGWLPPRIGASLDVLGKPAHRSYSLYGEDAVVRGALERSIFEAGGRAGFEPANLSYVDVGAWRPVSGSNTYWLYRRSARGTLVEPNPHMARLLRRVRPGDQVLEVACAEAPSVQFHMFGRHAESNTGNRDFAEFIRESQGRHPLAVVTTPAMPLSDILETHLSRHRTIFMLSVDIEGDDLAALESVTWQGPRRPRFLVAEVSRTTPSLTADEPITALLAANGYDLLAQCGVSRVFVSSSQ